MKTLQRTSIVVLLIGGTVGCGNSGVTDDTTSTIDPVTQDNNTQLERITVGAEPRIVVEAGDTGMLTTTVMLITARTPTTMATGITAAMLTMMAMAIMMATLTMTVIDETTIVLHRVFPTTETTGEIMPVVNVNKVGLVVL